MTEGEFAEQVAPTLRLFMSVDLEGSTQLKQRAGNRRGKWLTEVLFFYKEFKTQFQAKIDALIKSPDIPAIAPPEIWKTLGDEIIFVTKIESGRDLMIYVRAFCAALHAYNEIIADENREETLRVKGTAWVAEFPVSNTPLLTPDGRVDFAGPSIDTGFRLSRLSTALRLTISVELTWLLLKSGMIEAEPIHFDGSTLLKGLSEDTGYPYLWLQVGTSRFVALEREFSGRDRESDREKLTDLCETFIQEFGVPRNPPFLPNGLEIAPMPSGYDEEVAKVADYLRANVYFVEEGAPTEGSAPTQSDTEINEEILTELGGGAAG